MLDFHPDAKAEANAAALWYRSCNEAVAQRFEGAINYAFEQIKAHPKRWPVYHYSTRIYRIERFPYAVVYLSSESIVVVAVAHLHREPGYWKSRLQD